MTKKTLTCVSCGKEMDPDVEDAALGERGTPTAGKDLCEPCYSNSDVVLTIRIYEHEEDLTEDEYGQNVFEITGTKNMTAEEGPKWLGLWRAKWVSTDPWRGYYSVVPPKGWRAFHEDLALAMSEDAQRLARFDRELKEALAKKGIILVRAVARTSNLFSSSVDYYVQKKDYKVAHALAEELKKSVRS